ncbi:hypothetical protein AB0J74_12390 [Asanoa sp. NPDC049573]|uniref:hypothetical protein n=1 Tax=Asanoa sp. NPDC049573 TaxID=3155396 RepID=UPI003442ADB9
MNPTSVLIALAVIAFVLVRRLAGMPLDGRRLALLPVVLSVWGVTSLAQGFDGTLHAYGTDVGLLALGALLAFGGGLVRGVTVKLYPRDGRLWYRYTWITVAVWVGLILLRVVQLTVGWAVGADTSVLAAGLPLMLGLSMIGEVAVLGARRSVVRAS